MNRISYIGILLSIIALCYSCDEFTQLFPSENNTLFLNDSIIGYSNDNRLAEISGMVSSRNNPGYFWVHNDQYNVGQGKLFLIDSSMHIHQEVIIGFASHYTMQNDERVIYTDTVISYDWEDITFQQVEDTNYLVIADIGDNYLERDSVCLYRIIEPTYSNNDDSRVVVNGEKMILQYTDGPKNAETIMWDPITGNIVLVSKDQLSVDCYSFPFENTSLTISSSANLLLSLITSGDVNSHGDIILKNYWNVFLYTNNNQQSTLDLLKNGTRELVNYKHELQGEAICWGLDDQSYFVTSEKQEGGPQPFYMYY